METSTHPEEATCEPFGFPFLQGLSLVCDPAQTLCTTSPPRVMLLADIIQSSASSWTLLEGAEEHLAESSLASPLVLSRCLLSSFLRIPDHARIFSALQNPTGLKHELVKIGCSISGESSQ